MKAGTVVMLFPDEWHTYAPDPETGWEEWWVGFRGENIDRRVAEGFFSPKTPLLHIGHSAGIVSCYQEIIRSAEEERKGFQQLVTGIVLHLLGSCSSNATTCNTSTTRSSRRSTAPAK